MKKLNVLLFCLCVLVATSLDAYGQVTIERLAPENSVLVLGSKSVKSMNERLQRTSLWTLWQSEQFKALRADAVKEMGKDIERFLQDIGAEEGSLVPPSGPVGLAVFTVVDEELGLPSIAMLAMAEYGEDAERTHNMVHAALNRAERDGDIEFEPKDVLGREVLIIDLAKMKAKHQDEQDMPDFGAMFPMPNPADMFEGIDKVFYVRDKNSIMLSTDLTSLTEALERADGKGRASVADRPEFKTITQKLGDQDAFAVLLTRDIMQVVSAMDPTQMAASFQPTLRALFGEVQGYGLGMRLDGTKAMMEQNLFVYMPNGKRGLTALMDRSGPRAALPIFAGQDAVSYTSFNFEFRRLSEVMRAVVASNPLLQMNAGEELNQVEAVMNQITATLGTQVHMAKFVSRPLNADSSNTLVAIEATNPQEFENVFAQYAPQMGMEARDFLGQRIYSMDPNMMGMMMPMGTMKPVSLGIGGGFVMFGPTPAVEQALRATGQPAGAGLGADRKFQRAAGVLSPEPVVAWGYSDTVEGLEASIAEQRETMKKSIEQMRQFDPDTAKEMEEALAEQGILEKIDFTLLRRHLGPAAWQVISTTDGFMMNAYQLAAEQ